MEGPTAVLAAGVGAEAVEDDDHTADPEAGAVHPGAGLALGPGVTNTHLGST